MKRKWMVCLTMPFILIILIAYSKQDEFPVLKGPYFGQKPPGDTPELFAPGIVSRKEYFEHGPAFFSPDLKEIYWVADYVNAKNRNLFFMKLVNGKWTPPRAATFCEHYSGANFSFSSDGKRLYFSSRRSLEKDGDLKDTDIWVVERVNDTWSEPINLGPSINTDQTEALGTVIADGTIYFSDYRQIYSSKMKSGKYQRREKLSKKINTEDGFNIAPFVAQDESYIIFESNRPGGHGGADLYISYKTRDNSWLDPVNLGNKINTSGHERSPYVSPDKKYLFFWRVTDGSDIYWVDAKIIEDLKPEDLK